MTFVIEIPKLTLTDIGLAITALALGIQIGWGLYNKRTSSRGE